jgi:hypothetical protein
MAKLIFTKLAPALSSEWKRKGKKKKSSSSGGKKRRSKSS